jgi:ATP-dependent exoDNAse (exonuclease V) alpha subunit
MPESRQEWKDAIKEARELEDFEAVQEMTEEWIDLRAAYSCTINKSQGSTYDKVFIDLDDLKKCRDTNQLARMLYVGVSRARNNVYLTGDLV